MTMLEAQLPWPSVPIAVLSVRWSWDALSPLDLLFLAGLGTVGLALVLGRWRRFTPLLTAGYGVQFWALSHANVLTGEPMVASLALRVLRQPVVWRYDSLSWFFAMLTIGAAFVTSLCAFSLSSPAADRRSIGIRPAGNRTGNWHRFHVALALSVVASLGLFGSGNLLALYLGWELVVWAYLLLLLASPGISASAALRYAGYSFFGGMGLLGALALLFQGAGSLDFAQVRQALPSLGALHGFMIVAFLMLGIGLRLTALPLLGWRTGQRQPPAPVFWHAIGARVGFYAVLVLLVETLGFEWFSGVGSSLGASWLDLRSILIWSAAALIVLGVWRAWGASSPGALLGWLGLGQTGYVLLAFSLGGSFGSASGLLSLFALGLAEAALAGYCLFLLPHATFAKSSGRGMSVLALAVALIAMASLLGLPPTLGFVAKWLLVAELLDTPLLAFSRWPLLGIAGFGWLLTLLALLRLARFVRRPPNPTSGDHEQPPEMSHGVMAPLLGLSALTLLAGVVPGPALGWIAAIQDLVAVPVLDWQLTGIEGRLNMLMVGLLEAAVLLPVLVPGWFMRRSKARRQPLEAGPAAVDQGDPTRTMARTRADTLPVTPPAATVPGDEAAVHTQEGLLISGLNALTAAVWRLTGFASASWALAAMLIFMVYLLVSGR